MRVILFCISLGLILTLSASCKKKGGGNAGPCTETGLAFTSTPAIGTVQTPTTGPNFPLVVNLTNIPSSGVRITVTARPENPSNAPAFFTETRTSSQAVNNFSITGTPVNVISIVEIKVVSTSCATNDAEGTYRYSRKN